MVEFSCYTRQLALDNDLLGGCEGSGGNDVGSFRI